MYSVAASVSDDATVKIFDYDSGEVERTFKGHTGAINDVAFNSTGTILATASNDL